MNAASVNRPGWIEVVAILAGCAILLVVLARMDERASRAHAARAAAAIQKRAAGADSVQRRALGERAAAADIPRAGAMPGRPWRPVLSGASASGGRDAVGVEDRVDLP